MRVIEVRVDRADFDKTLAHMREWLDRNRRPLVRFQTDGDERAITIKVQFEEANDQAERFRRAFNGSYAG